MKDDFFQFTFMCFLPWIVGVIFLALNAFGLVVVPMEPLIFVGAFWLVISPAATALSMLVAFRNGRDKCR